MADTLLMICTILSALWLFFTVVSLVLIVVAAFQKVKLERELNTFIKNERARQNDKYKEQ